MKFKFHFFAFTLLISANISSQTYVVDAGHSSVQIQVERFGLVDVVGRFKDVSGKITFDDQDISKTVAEAIIKVDSYDANNKGGEKAVLSKAFLDAQSFPEITFVSNRVLVKNGTTALNGFLTIHGTTNEIELPFTIKGPLLDLPTGKQSIAFVASTTVDRRDYGIAFDKKLSNGIEVVGNNVKITVVILALEE
jgi:polyisoprenoid-binding protein YceI